MNKQEIKELLEIKKQYGDESEGGILDDLIQSVILAALFGVFVMLLWNVLLPDLFGLPEIDYLQSVGIIILARLIFGGVAFSKADRKSKKRLDGLSKLDSISDWKHYDKFWEEEGKAHFEKFKSQQGEK